MSSFQEGRELAAKQLENGMEYTPGSSFDTFSGYDQGRDVWIAALSAAVIEHQKAVKGLMLLQKIIVLVFGVAILVLAASGCGVGEKNNKRAAERCLMAAKNEFPSCKELKVSKIKSTRGCGEQQRLVRVSGCSRDVWYQFGKRPGWGGDLTCWRVGN